MSEAGGDGRSVAATSKPSVALLGGTGRLGTALALRLAAAGHAVVIGSRDAGRAAEAARSINDRLASAEGVEQSDARVTGAENAGAAAGADVVVVTVPYESQQQTLRGLEHAVAARVVISTAVPVRFVPGTGPAHVDVPEGSAAEQVAELLPDARVVSALQTVSSATLGKLDRDVDADVIVTGDDDEAKRIVAAMLQAAMGARPVDGGPLRNSRYVEQLTVLLLTINMRARRNTGLRLTNLPDAAAFGAVEPARSVT